MFDLNVITPVSIISFSLFKTFQLIMGFVLSVLIPNFTDSPILIVSEDVKIITPCWFFSPIHPFSVLNDSKLKSSWSQILKVLISCVESFVNVIIVDSSNPILAMLISLAYTFDGIKIKDTENNIIVAKMIFLLWGTDTLFLFSILSPVLFLSTLFLINIIMFLYFSLFEIYLGLILW